MYDDKDYSKIKSNTIRFLLPSNFQVYTGFTPLGLSVKVSKHIDINAEWSVWSYEAFNFGVKYNFDKLN